MAYDEHDQERGYDDDNVEVAAINKPSKSKINYFNGIVMIVGVVLAVLNLWELVDEELAAKINQTFVIVSPAIPVITMTIRTFYTNKEI